MTVNEPSALDAAPKVGMRGLSLQASSILAGVSSGGSWRASHAPHHYAHCE